MDPHALTINSVRDRPACTRIPRDSGTGQQDPAPAEPGAPFPAGTESCP